MRHLLIASLLIGCTLSKTESKPKKIEGEELRSSITKECNESISLAVENENMRVCNQLLTKVIKEGREIEGNPNPRDAYAFLKIMEVIDSTCSN